MSSASKMPKWWEIMEEEKRLSTIVRTEVDHKIKYGFKCTECDRVTKFKCVCILHMRDVHGINLKNQELLNCTECSYTTFNKSYLSIHIKTHTGEQKRPFKCTECSYAAAQQKQLTDHMRTHTGEKPYKCDLCDKTFAFEQSLKPHARMHAGERPYKCNLCDHAAQTSNCLRNHRRQVHGVDKTSVVTHKCTVCSYTTSERANLVRHLTVHTNERPFKCVECDYAAKTKGDLKQHMRTHSNERLHKCTVCEKAFKTKADLRSHMKTHTKEKPFKCNLCNFAAKIISQLNHHVKQTHGTDNKSELHCPHCVFTTFISKDMNDHLATHTTLPSLQEIDDEKQCRAKSAKQTLALARNANDSNGKQHNCFECMFVAKTDKLLKEHVKVNHTPEFKCTECEHVSKIKWNCISHMRDVHGIHIKNSGGESCHAEIDVGGAQDHRHPGQRGVVGESVLWYGSTALRQAQSPQGRSCREDHGHRRSHARQGSQEER